MPAPVDLPINTLDRLAAVDFQLLGEWTELDDALDYRFTPETPVNRARLIGAALYAFVCRDSVLYIGKTSVGLKQRFGGYCKPANDQSTNLKCHRHIRKMLAEGKTIQIYALSGDTPLRWGGFEINLAAGLEDSLISELEPPWNGRAGARLVTDSEMVEREALHLPEYAPEPMHDVVTSQVLHADLNALPQTQQAQPPKANEGAFAAAEPAHDKAVPFTVELGKTYYFKGFINVPARLSDELGAQGEPLVFFLGRQNPATVETKIDRKANLTGAPRLYGGQKIARWFQKHFREGDTLNATIVSANEIILEDRQQPVTDSSQPPTMLS